MELNKVRYFYTIAVEGSFTKAAQRLGIAQSSLSDAILKLEYSLKTALFIRTPKGVTLTADGETLFHHARNIIIESENAIAAIRHQKNEVAGKIRLLTTYGFASTNLFPHLIQFLKTYPDVQLTLVCNDEDLDIKVREADVSIRPYIPNIKNFHQVYLTSNKQNLYASFKYLEKHGLPKTVDDLKQHFFVIFDNPQYALPYGEIEWVLGIGNTNSFRKTQLIVNSVECLYQAAVEGLGIIALSQRSALLKTGQLLPILPTLHSQNRKLYFTYPKELTNIKAIETLKNYLVEIYKTTTH